MEARQVNGVIVNLSLDEASLLVKKLGAINIDDEGGLTLAHLEHPTINELSEEVKDDISQSPVFKFFRSLKASL